MRGLWVIDALEFSQPVAVVTDRLNVYVQLHIVKNQVHLAYTSHGGIGPGAYSHLEPFQISNILAAEIVQNYLASFVGAYVLVGRTRGSFYISSFNSVRFERAPVGRGPDTLGLFMWRRNED